MEDVIRPVHIIPDLSFVAKQQIKSWRSEGKYNQAFYRALEQLPNVKCKNCGDTGFVMVSFTRAGPFNSIPGHKPGEVLAWFDGNENAGKGWYIVTKTISYPCQHCEANNKKEDEQIDTSRVKPETIQAGLEEIAREWWDE